MRCSGSGDLGGRRSAGAASSARAASGSSNRSNRSTGPSRDRDLDAAERTRGRRATPGGHDGAACVMRPDWTEDAVACEHIVFSCGPRPFCSTGEAEQQTAAGPTAAGATEVRPSDRSASRGRQTPPGAGRRRPIRAAGAAQSAITKQLARPWAGRAGRAGRRATAGARPTSPTASARHAGLKMGSRRIASPRPAA